MRIKKASGTAVLNGNVVDDIFGNSTENASSQNSINNVLTYSTEERRIGTWKNGKPVYSKYIEFSVPNTGTTTLEHNLNIDELVDIKAKVSVSGQSIEDFGIRPIPFFSATSFDYHFLITSIKENDIEFHTSWENNTAYITFEYTKTTD